MTAEQIAALPVGKLAEKDAHLYLWTINHYIEDAYFVAREWGFTPSTLLVWCKSPHGFGLGGTYCLTTEYILFARRGRLAANCRIDRSWWEWPRGRHSEKPEDFREMVERVSPSPRLELFARHKPNVWHYWGNEIESDIVMPNDLPQPQPPGSQAPPKRRSSESLATAENGRGGGCWLQGAG
jgi:N6-adenosine-specific RNA methylase IME4